MTITLPGRRIDYDKGPYLVTFPILTTSVPLIVTINDDNICEISETFTVTIDPNSLPMGVIRGSRRQTTITLLDGDRKFKILSNQNLYI